MGSLVRRNPVVNLGILNERSSLCSRPAFRMLRIAQRYWSEVKPGLIRRAMASNFDANEGLQRTSSIEVPSLYLSSVAANSLANANSSYGMCVRSECKFVSILFLRALSSFLLGI